MNLQIEITKQNLVNDINNSGLPVGVVLYIMKDLVNDLEKNYNQIINNEYNKQMQEQDGETEEITIPIELEKEEEE